jgi:hypothetical protein
MAMLPRIQRRTVATAALTTLVALTGGACDDGDGAAPVSDGPPGADGGGPADPDAASDAAVDLPPDGPIPAGLAPASPYAGLWLGKTSQDLPVSLLVAEDGTITDATLRFQLEYPDSGWCAVEFTPVTLPRLIDGVASPELRTTVATFRIPSEVRFTSPTAASGTFAGYTGAYDINCGSQRRMGSGLLLAAGQFQLERASGPTVPAAGDRALAAGRGSPVPIGFTQTTCNHGAGSPARVCAFGRFGPTGKGELWVADLNRPAGRACGAESASDPAGGCWLLSDKLVMTPTAGAQGFPGMHRFHGDTLIFRELPPPPESAAGPLLAWRPGWPAARKLVDRGSSCTASETSDAVACVAGYTVGATGPGFADLWAGRLGDGTAPLTQIARLMLVTTADRALPSLPATYQFGLSPAGDEVLWSARVEDTPTAVSTLFAAKLANPASPQLLAADVRRWRFSRDGRYLFWMRGFLDATDTVVAQGTLERVPYPVIAGTAPRGLGQVQDFIDLGGSAAGPEALLLLTSTGSLELYPDFEPGPPEGRVIDTQVAALRTFSSDLGRVAYAKTLAAPGSAWGDLYVATLDGSAGAPCWVGTDPDLVSPVFSSSSASLVVGRDVDDVTNDTTLLLVDARTCRQTHKVASVRNWQRMPGDRFLIAPRSLPLRRFGMVSLALLDGSGAAEPTPLVSGVSGNWGARWEGSGAGATRIDLVYGVNAGWRSDGVYHRVLTY